MNLKDRMLPEQPSSESPETERMKDTESECNIPASSSSKNTMLSSNPRSPEQILLAKQSEMIRMLTEQRDRLIAQGRPEDQKKIAALTDRLSLVKKELMRRDSVHQSSLTEVQTKLESALAENTELKESLTRARRTNYTLRDENKVLTTENEDLRKNEGLATRQAYLNLKERCDAAEADNKRLQVMADTLGYERLLKEKDALKEERSQLLGDIKNLDAAADLKIREAESKVQDAEREISSLCNIAFISWLLLFCVVFGGIIGAAVFL